MATLPAGTPSTASALYNSQISSWTEACLRFFFFASLISYTFFPPPLDLCLWCFFVFACVHWLCSIGKRLLETSDVDTYTSASLETAERSISFTLNSCFVIYGVDPFAGASATRTADLCEALSQILRACEGHPLPLNITLQLVPFDQVLLLLTRHISVII
jgi:hypothetical protein